MWQVICLENSGEVCSHETRLDDFTYLIDIDVIKVKFINCLRIFSMLITWMIPA